MVKTLKEHFTPPTSATTVEQEPKSNMPPNAERHVALMFCYFPWRSTSKHVHRRPKTPLASSTRQHSHSSQAKTISRLMAFS